VAECDGGGPALVPVRADVRVETTEFTTTLKGQMDLGQSGQKSQGGPPFIANESNKTMFMFMFMFMFLCLRTVQDCTVFSCSVPLRPAADHDILHLLV
jgi:hypothetical protein